MKVVITGASGFVGSALVRVLQASGASVLGVGRRQSSAPGYFQVGEYADTPAGDVLFHLAECNDRAAVERMGPEYMSRCISLIDGLSSKASKLVYVSSAAVYGDRSLVPHPPFSPVFATDHYTRTKLACEARVRQAGGVVARLSNLYGPGMPANNVVSAILNQIPGNGPLRVRDTLPVRDFLWIEDAAEGIAACAREKCGEVFNIASAIGISIAQLARTALEQAGERERVVMATHLGKIPSCLVLDIASTTEMLGWKPRLDLPEGLRRMLALSPSMARAQ